MKAGIESSLPTNNEPDVPTPIQGLEHVLYMYVCSLS